MVFDFCVNAIIDALIDTNNKLKRYKQQYRISAKNGELYIVTIYYVLWISSSLSLGTEESSTTVLLTLVLLVIIGEIFLRFRGVCHSHAIPHFQLHTILSI